MNADLDLRSKRLPTEAVFLSALLEYTQRIPNSLACVLVLASLDNLLDEASCSGVRLIFRVGVQAPR
jgi:hypothetical protein